MSLQDPSQFDAERRFLLVLLLSTAVLLVSQYFVPLGVPEPVSPEPAVESTESPGQPPAVEAAEPAASTPGEPDPVVEEVEATRGESRSVQVEGRDLRLTFETAGAVISSARLLGYSSRLVEGEALELIPQSPPPSLPRPLSVRSGDPKWDAILADAVYEVEGAGTGRVTAPAELTFRFRGGGLQVTRRVRIPAEGYLIEWETELRANGLSQPYSLVLGPGIGRLGVPESAGGFLGGASAGDFVHPQVAYFQEDSVTRYGVGDVEEPVRIGGPFRWVASDSQFFTYLVLAPDALESLALRRESWREPDADPEETPPELMLAEARMSPGAGCGVYLGPKDLDVLKTVDPTLSQLVDYGWFAILVEPLLFVLKLIYQFVGNYGWAIILLTFLINLALLPIRYKQVISMKKMGKLQPKLKAIQERYKKLARDDPKRQDMNKEIMALYQEHGVNPLGGCLPLLIQMPFLLAFYRMLASSIELRGAPFVLWISDLSVHDPYYVTPVASGVMMMAQQQMTPATGDPMQRRMMMIMPLMLTYFFLWVSSGLALYFLFSTFFGILFQIGIQRMEKSEEAKPPSTPKKKSKKGKAK